MAIDANSTPTSARPLLAAAAAPGRLLPTDRTPRHFPSGAEIVRLDHSRRLRWDSAATEFQQLADERDRIDARMRVLMDVLDPDRSIRQPKAKPVTLPRSGLVEAAPGVLLFRSRRDA